MLRKTSSKWLLLLMVLLASRNVVASPRQNDYDESLIIRIQSGDISAIVEAGNSKNRVFVPYLREELKDQRHKGTDLSPKEPARHALAKLGETEQLQECWCRALNDDPDMGLATPLLFEQIGGWFSIQALQFFLTPAGKVHWNKAMAKYGAKNPHEDVIFPPPSALALETLAKLVPNPPPHADHLVLAPDEKDQQVKLWQNYIAAHKDELSKLQPTGEGVDFSDKACKNGKPVKKKR
jgi:hypothetical protein